MLFQLFDEPARIINADEELIVRGAEKGPGQLTQLDRGSARQFRQLTATPLVDQAFLEIDPDLRIGALKQFLDLAKERFVHSRSDA